MSGAARRWAELMDGWTIPDEALFQATEDPWATASDGVVAPPPAEDSPSRRLALEALPRDGRVLDVGCGAGAASLALAPPADWVVGVDRSAEMLDAFSAACRARRVHCQAVLGEWPGAAADVDEADVVVCHHVVYGARDIVAFVVELTGRARRRVVVEMGAVHPSVPLGPLWRYFWKIDRPNGPTAKDFLAVLAEAGIDPVVEQAPGPPPLASPLDGAAAARRQLCLPVEREPEVARGLAVLPKVPTDVWTFAWPGDG